MKITDDRARDILHSHQPPSAPVGVEGRRPTHCVFGAGDPKPCFCPDTQDHMERQPAAVVGLSSRCDLYAVTDRLASDRDYTRGEAVDDLRLILAQQHAACVGCEGNPAPENSPCAVCGQQPAAVDDDDPCPSCYGSEEVGYCGRCGKGAVL